MKEISPDVPYIYIYMILNMHELHKTNVQTGFESDELDAWYMWGLKIHHFSEELGSLYPSWLMRTW